MRQQKCEMGARQMSKWVKAKKRNKFHLVINNRYVCNHALGKVYTKEIKPLPVIRLFCCKNCLRYARKVQDK